MTVIGSISEEMTPEEFKAHGAKHLTNTGGIEIMFNESQDGVYYRYVYGQDLSKEPIYEAEIQHDAEGEPYFMNHHQEADYLSEYLRIG